MKKILLNKIISVLVIDDDPKVSKLIEFILSKAGFHVQKVFDGLHAIEYLVNNIPDLILCDILMPEMSGIEVLTYIKNREPLKNIPIIAVTALAMTGYKEKFLDHGFDAYFTKPINIADFAGQILPYVKSIRKEATNDKQTAGGYTIRRKPETEKQPVTEKSLAIAG
jgi:CheY-like chemotaxis protein